MILFAKEASSRGDSYGYSVDNDGQTIFNAVRTFIIKVDSAEDRSMDEVLAWLPQKGDPHPYIPEAAVIAVKVGLEGADPHIYIATVEYGDNKGEDNDGKKADDSNPEYPWNQRAIVTYQSDDSIKEVDPFAYAVWAPRLSTAQSLATLYNESPIHSSSAIPNVNIHVWPTQEPPSSLPEEPAPSFGLQVSMAIKGYTNLDDRRVHDPSVVSAFKQQCFTVNAQPVSLFGQTINKYCGYLSNFTIVPKFHLNRWRRVFAYYDISIQIADKPSSWVRLVQNMSKNRLQSAQEQGVLLSHIKLQDPETGLLERITSPVAIHPDTGQPLAITQDHQFNPNNTDMYVVPYLTKRPDNWYGLQALDYLNNRRPLR